MNITFSDTIWVWKTICEGIARNRWRNIWVTKLWQISKGLPPLLYTIFLFFKSNKGLAVFSEEFVKNKLWSL